MTVTDKQVAALHVQLAGRTPDEHLRLFNELDEPDYIGYGALLAAGLFEAIQRRFAKDGKVAERSEVIDFVATVRARSETSPDEVNPDIAERIIMHALGEGSISEIDNSTMLRHQIILLAGLVAQAHYSEAELDAFMRQIRADAEEMLE